MSTFEIVKGETGKCLLLDGTRIAGPKAWGGGTVESTFTTKEAFYQERTCKDVGEINFFRCSKCGCELMLVAGIWITLYAGEVNYCPNCGAKVVE